MASKFARSHNSIPLGFSVLTIVLFVFTAGTIFNRFEYLERNYSEYVRKQEERDTVHIKNLKECEEKITNLSSTITDIQARMPAVRGVTTTRQSTSSAEIKVAYPTWTPTPKPQ